MGNTVLQPQPIVQESPVQQTIQSPPTPQANQAAPISAGGTETQLMGTPQQTTLQQHTIQDYLGVDKGAETLALHVPFLGLPNHLLKKIYANGEIVRIPQHTNIIVEGENSAGMYILLEGLAGVYKSEGANRKGNLIKTLTQGEAFGEMSLLDRAPRSASVAAEVPVLLFHFSDSAFDQTVDSDPALGLKLYRNFAMDMSSRLRSLSDDLIVSQRQLWKMNFSRKP